MGTNRTYIAGCTCLGHWHGRWREGRYPIINGPTLQDRLGTKRDHRRGQGPCRRRSKGPLHISHRVAGSRIGDTRNGHQRSLSGGIRIGAVEPGRHAARQRTLLDRTARASRSAGSGTVRLFLRCITLHMRDVRHVAHLYLEHASRT